MNQLIKFHSESNYFEMYFKFLVLNQIFIVLYRDIAKILKELLFLAAKLLN